MTDDELALADAYTCLRSILQTGQSYEAGDGRVYTAANLKEVRDTISYLSNRIANANAANGESNVLTAYKGDWRRSC